MFLIYIDVTMMAGFIFGLGLFSLIASLGVSIREIIISIKALDIHLSNIENLRSK
jgi:hypothetical protein